MTRDRIRMQLGIETWSAFSDCLGETPPGNESAIGFYFDHHEIVPDCPAGDFRFNNDGDEVSTFTPAVEARAVIEHQCLAKRLHAESLGYCTTGTNGRVFITGGASNNAGIVQILADVFNSSVFVQEIADSAALGGAFLAQYGYEAGTKSFSELINVKYKMAARPNSDAAKIYDQLLERYRLLEDRIINKEHK